MSIEWFSGTGAGGQHRNKHQNSCRLTHIPTGITITAQCRKRNQSLTQAWADLEQRLAELQTSEASQAENSVRADMVGTGMRADKIRTYRFQDDRVKDHVTGKSAKCSQIMRGMFDKLH